MSEKRRGEISKQTLQTPRRPNAENSSPTQNFVHPPLAIPSMGYFFIWKPHYHPSGSRKCL
ncbi:MAG: hypothetical protein F6K58_14460 [Symploca sp. SIO2E9]|nr:hypothetical protein [Symploca sp. SIO2E9]